MKFSEAMLKGFEKVGGRQCRGQMYVREDGRIVAACVLGAARLGGYPKQKRPAEFAWAWGRSEIIANDIDKLPWEHIYGMAVAAEL